MVFACKHHAIMATKSSNAANYCTSMNSVRMRSQDMKYFVMLISFVSYTIFNLNLYSQDVNNDTYMQQKMAAYKEIVNIDSFLKSLPDNEKYEIYGVFLSGSDKCDDVLEKLKYFPELKGVNIYQSKVSLLLYNNLKYLHNLETLRLDEVPFTDAEMIYIKDMKTLEELYLYNTSITNEGLKNIKDLKNLKKLGLSNPNITDEGLIYLTSLDNLVLLYLGETKISDKGLIYLSGKKSLRTLDLHSTYVTVDGLLKIDGLDNLTSLDLAETKFSRESASVMDAEEERLKKHFPMLKIVTRAYPPKYDRTELPKQIKGSK
jgi:hypothetical protein